MRPVEAPPRNVHAYVTYAHAIDASECGCITQTYSYGHAARGPAFAHMAPRQSVQTKNRVIVAVRCSILGIIASRTAWLYGVGALSRSALSCFAFAVCRFAFAFQAQGVAIHVGGGILWHGRLALAIIAFPRSSLPHGASPGRLCICLCVPRLVRVPSPLTPSQLIHSHPLNCTVAYPHLHN